MRGKERGEREGRGLVLRQDEGFISKTLRDRTADRAVPQGQDGGNKSASWNIPSCFHRCEQTWGCEVMSYVALKMSKPQTSVRLMPSAVLA